MFTESYFQSRLFSFYAFCCVNFTKLLWFLKDLHRCSAPAQFSGLGFPRLHFEAVLPSDFNNDTSGGNAALMWSQTGYLLLLKRPWTFMYSSPIIRSEPQCGSISVFSEPGKDFYLFQLLNLKPILLPVPREDHYCKRLSGLHLF